MGWDDGQSKPSIYAINLKEMGLTIGCWRCSRIVNENYKRIVGDYGDYEQWLVVREYGKIMEVWMEKLGAWLEVLLMPPSSWEHESKLPTNLLEERVTMFKSGAKKFCLGGILKTIF